ncbi:MAG: hypothetical protein ABJP33_03290 [Pseudoruegeria sp.]
MIDELQRPIDPSVAAEISSGFLTPGDQCFKSDTPVQMWRLGPSVKPRADGTYEERPLLSKVWEKPICEIKVRDLVISYDDKGPIKPCPVTRTM